VGRIPTPATERAGAARGRLTERETARKRIEETTMALTITENCTACDACKPVCPNEAISVGDPVYVIDPLRCTECVGAEDEPQCKLVCPADCIVPHPDFTESQDELLAKYASLHG
jgi:ferredoxin